MIPCYRLLLTVIRDVDAKVDVDAAVVDEEMREKRINDTFLSYIENEITGNAMLCKQKIQNTK